MNDVSTPAATESAAVPQAEHTRLAEMVLSVLDAQQKYFKGRHGPDGHQLLREAKDHERRLRQVAEAALTAARRVPTLF